MNSLWEPLTPRDWWDDTTVWETAVKSASVVDSELLRAQRQSRSYAQTVLREMSAAPTRRLPPVDGVYQRSHVTMPDVYVRPAKTYRWVQSQAQDDPDIELAARRAARDRLWDLAQTDMKLSQNAAERDTYAASGKVVGYRRVVHPELAESKQSCGLCIVASTRFYTVQDMLPIHDRCNCGTMPITKGNDPGLKLNESDLNRLYRAAGSTSGRSSGSNPDGGVGLRAVRVSEIVHGELGTILAPEGARLRDHTDAKVPAWEKPTVASEKKMLRQQIALSKRWADEVQRSNREDASHEFTWGGKTYTASPSKTAVKTHRDAVNGYMKRLKALS